MGEMADLFMDGAIDFDTEDYDSPPNVTCRHCGKMGLSWGLRAGEWKLFDSRGLHKCPENVGKKVLTNVAGRIGWYT